MDSPWVQIPLLVLNSLAGVAGVVGLFIAVAAYRVGKRQELLAKSQTRITFELEVLHALVGCLDELAKECSPSIRDPRLPYISPAIFIRAGLLGRDELPLLKFVSAFGLSENPIRYKSQRQIVEDVISVEASSESARIAVIAYLYSEIGEAINVRTG